jgi:hypothetical protein
MKTYIINPDNNKPVSIEDWSKDKDPKRAQLLAIETEDGHLLVMSKSYLPGRHYFEEAQQMCKNFAPKGFDGITFRAPTRKETIDMYDARFQGLDEAIKLTGGDFACSENGNWYWTCERDTDPRCYASSAWYSGGTNGYLGSYGMYLSIQAVPVALLK